MDSPSTQEGARVETGPQGPAGNANLVTLLHEASSDAESTCSHFSQMPEDPIDEFNQIAQSQPEPTTTTNTPEGEGAMDDQGFEPEAQGNPLPELESEAEPGTSGAGASTVTENENTQTDGIFSIMTDTMISISAKIVEFVRAITPSSDTPTTKFQYDLPPNAWFANVTADMFQSTSGEDLKLRRTPAITHFQYPMLSPMPSCGQATGGLSFEEFARQKLKYPDRPTFLGSNSQVGRPLVGRAPPDYKQWSTPTPRPEDNDEFSYWPTPGVNYVIEFAPLLVLLQVRPRIPDEILNSGTFLAWIADSSDEDFQRIQRYFDNSKTPDFSNLRIKTILRITREADVEPHDLEQGLKMMLFHGTREENIGSILKTGLLPARSRFTGGIFFADRVSKSLGYCRNSLGGRSGGGWLFLCEVLMGTMYQGNQWSEFLPGGFNSIKRPGRRVPDETETEIVEDCAWPVGRNVEEQGQYWYNEYIVFSQRQARPRYLIRWELEEPSPREI